MNQGQWWVSIGEDWKGSSWAIAYLRELGCHRVGVWFGGHGSTSTCSGRGRGAVLNERRCCVCFSTQGEFQRFGANIVFCRIPPSAYISSSLSLLFKVRREYVATILMLIAPTERSWNQRPITSAQLWLHCMQQCEMSSSKDLISLRPFSILFTPDFCSVLITPRTARGTPATTPASPVCVRPSDGPCAWLDIRFLFSSSIQPPLPQQLSAQAAQHSPLSTVCTFHLGAFEGAGVSRGVCSPFGPIHTLSRHRNGMDCPSQVCTSSAVCAPACVTVDLSRCRRAQRQSNKLAIGLSINKCEVLCGLQR